MAPIAFCGGATPFEELVNNKAMTPLEASKVTDIIAPYQDQTLEICGDIFEVITFPGHTRGMIGIRTLDNILYCSDVVFGEETFRKYPILYYNFIDDAIHSFKKLKNLIPLVEGTVIYHGGLIPDLGSLIDMHEKRIFEIKERVFMMIFQAPLSLEELTAKMMQESNANNDIASYMLTKGPMQAFVAELVREDRVEIKVIDGFARAYAIEKTCSNNPHLVTSVV